MSAATDFLSQHVQQAANRAPSITVVTCQRSTSAPNFGPGVAGYGWGIVSQIDHDANGVANGLTFPEVYVWFSDRRTNEAQVNPPDWQQFSAAKKDLMKLEVVVDGDSVDLTATLRSWGDAQWKASTETYDAPSQQLVFSVPGAGAGAPPAVMLMSFAANGGGGFL
jgi:hypothetical protein